MRNRLRYGMNGICLIGLVLIFAFSLTSLTGCSAEDIVKDVVDEDVDFDADLELDELTVQNPPAAALARSFTIDNSGTVSVKNLLDAADLDYDTDIVDIDSVDLQYVDVSYSATWDNLAVTQFTCTLTIDGALNSGGPVEITETIVSSQTPTTLTAITLSVDAESIINAYLASRNTPFTYALSCEVDDAIGDVTVTYSANLGVHISGNI